MDDEFCHGHSEHLRSKCQRQERQWNARYALAEFSEFVKREDSSVLPAIEAIAAVGTPGTAAELLGTTKSDFCRIAHVCASWVGASRRVSRYREGEDRIRDT